MNILYLTTHLNIGGISSYLLTLAGGLKRRGHNVYVASSGGELVPKFNAAGIIYVPMPINTKQELSPKILISLFKLLKYIKEKDIDIIHSNTRVTQVLSCLLSRFSGKPYISTCHGFFKARIARKVFPCWGKIVIAVSEQVKEHLMRDFGIKEEKISVIHNGIDVEKFSLTTKKVLGLNDAPVVGIIARLSDVKGHIYLIEAIKLVLKEVPDAQLLIVGEGKEKEGLVSSVKRLGLEKSVFFIPRVYDTQTVLSAMDLFVMPSLKEGLGLSLMEAMAAGLAVIGSDVGGIKTLINDGYNGLLVPPADARQLSRAILKLLRDPDMRKYLGDNARVFITQNFSQGKMVSETEGVYLECLNVRD